MRCKHAWYTYRFCENILLSIRFFLYSYLMSHHQSEKVRLGRIFRYIALFADAEGSTILGLSHFWKIELKIASRSLLDRDLRAASCSSQCFLVIVCMLRLASVVYASFLNLDWSRLTYLIFGLFDFFFQPKQCFISQHFIQDSVFHPLSAKFQQTERGLNVCG